MLLIFSLMFILAENIFLSANVNIITADPIEKPAFFEDFKQLDTSIWQIQLYGWLGNGCDMLNKALEVSNSYLKIQVGKLNVVHNEKQYFGGGMGTNHFFSYGKYIVRMKNNIKSGTVSSFFIMNQWKSENWEHQEIDIEFLGKNPNIVQLTVHYYRDKGLNHVQHTHIHQLGFDSTEDFHEYTIHWQKQKVDWYIDDKCVHSETRDLPDDKEMQIRLNHWLADPKIEWAVDWLGKVDDRSLPSEVYYDWIRYESESLVKN